MIDIAIENLKTAPVTEQFCDDTGCYSYLQWAKENVDNNNARWNELVEIAAPCYTVSLLKEVVNAYQPKVRRIKRACKYELKEIDHG